MKAKRIKAHAALQVPQTRDQVVEAIAEIGRLARERTRIEADLNDQVAVLKEAAETKAQPIGERIEMLSSGVQMWCEANRAALTQGGKIKTVILPSGEVRWRISPPKVVIRGVEAVLDALRRAGLERFIRTDESPNKEAILAEPAAVTSVRGIRIDQHEEFVVVPYETELADTPVPTGGRDK